MMEREPISVSSRRGLPLERNLDLAFDFALHLVADPSLLTEIPEGSTVILLPRDDQRLTEFNTSFANDLMAADEQPYVIGVRHAQRVHTPRHQHTGGQLPPACRFGFGLGGRKRGEHGQHVHFRIAFHRFHRLPYRAQGVRNLSCCAVSQADPHHLGRRATPRIELAKVGILRYQNIAMETSILAHRLIGGAVQSHRRHTAGLWIDIPHVLDQPG